MNPSTPKSYGNKWLVNEARSLLSILPPRRVTFGARCCRIIMTNDLWSNRLGTVRKRGAAMSLTELLCVVAIIAILAALYLPAVVRAFVRIKKFLGDI